MRGPFDPTPDDLAVFSLISHFSPIDHGRADVGVLFLQSPLSWTMTTVSDGQIPDSSPQDIEEIQDGKRKKQPTNNAATGASAAGMRSVAVQFMTFYFRAPITAFFRSRVE